MLERLTTERHQSRFSDSIERLPTGTLSLQGICKQFGDFRAVDDFTLEVASGEFITLLGASGSGKTTILLMIAGLLPVTAGRILLEDADVTNLPAHSRNLGMVFQSYALFPHMTVFDNVAYPLKRRKTSKSDIGTKVRAALDLVSLGGFEHRYPRELSGGQQQRVALARATVYGPSVLLMDEPLSALDRKLRRNLQVEIKRFHRELGATVIYVTHDQEEALALSDRVVLLRDGSIEQMGSPTELYERPHTLYAAGFLGEANILKGTLSRRLDGGLASVTLSNGMTVNGFSCASVQLGEDVAVVVRPERLQVSEGRDVGVRVQLDEAIYLGEKVRISGTFETGDSCITEMPSERWGDLQKASSVGVSWEGAAATVVDATQGSAGEK